MLRTRIVPAGFIEPCLPTKADTLPSGPGWIHEIKHDGYRLMARRDGRGVRLVTRGGHDWTDRYPGVTVSLRMLPGVSSCLIDGEIVVCDAGGRADFELLRHGAARKPEAVLLAFDLLERNGEDLRRQPLEARKDALALILAPGPGGIVFNQTYEADGEAVFREACQLGLEGVVSKRRGSPYLSGRCQHWLKAKNPTAPAVRREAEEDWGKRRVR